MTEVPTLLSRKTSVPENGKGRVLKTGNGPKLSDSPQSVSKSPAAISFVRNRMFYARAALNAKGGVTFGLRHIRESKI